MKKLNRVNFLLPDQELQKIDRYCEAVGRSRTDVLREFIRSLEIPVELSQP